MFKPSLLTCLAGVSMLFLADHCRGEMPATAYDSWKSYKVGTTIVVEETDSDHPEKHRRLTTKLLKLSEGAAEIEEVGDGPDAKPSTRLMRDQKMSELVQSRKATATQPANPVEGDEEIEVAGQKVRAHWMKDVRTKDLSYTYWISEKVPGAIAVLKTVEVREGHPTRERMWKVVEIKQP